MTAKPETNSKIFALRAAQWVGCTGAHKHDGKWMPCETHEELERISNAAEPDKKSGYQEMNERYFKRRAKGKNKKKGWEKLRETKPLGGFATLEGGGIVSAPINSTIYSGGVKSYIPGISPRDNDPDVFVDIESARKRSRMLGCIGVRRMPSATGRTVWLPCTNNSDYARLAGTTFLGRRNQRESQNRMIRTIIRRELRNSSKNKLRNKSLFEEIYGTKGLGGAIGRALTPNVSSRGLRQSLQRIEGVLDPSKRRDMDRDGMIFDGTWREMVAPTRGGLSSETDGIDEVKPRWASPVRNNWFTPNKIKKGGVLKAQEILNFDRLRLRKNRDEQASVLGVTREVIDAMHKPDASIDAFDADRLVMSALNLHPILIFGDAWLIADKTPNQPKTRNVGKLDDRDNRILEIRANGGKVKDIADELKVSKQRASQLLRRALERNEQDLDSRGLSSSTTNPMKRGDGMIQRDERGNPIRQADRRKETVESSIAKLKKLGLSDEEINLLFTGNRATPVDPKTPDIDTNAARGLRSSTNSMSLSEMAKSSPSTWPEKQKIHFIDWANSKPSFNVPYALAQKFKRDGDLSDVEWQRILNFYSKYGPENRGLSSSTTPNATNFSNVGARRMGQIILDRVRQDRRNKKPGTRVHYHVVGPGAVGKSTLTDYLVKNGLMPPDTDAAHIDPDFIKQGIIGYDGGKGSVSVHRESARSATKTVESAAKEGMDIVTEGTGYRLYEYKTTSDPSYKKVAHIPFLPYDKAEARLAARNAEGGRQLPIDQIRLKGQQLYGWLTNHLNKNEIQDMYIWDMDVPEGAAPRVIAKIEDGVFRAIDEPAFKRWSEQSGGGRGGDSNLSWFKRNFPQK